jgi:hypothetical protein
MNLKWHRITATNKEVGRSEGGSVSVTRLADGQYTVRNRRLPNTSGPLWNWVKDSVGRKREFDTLDEALEQARIEREKLAMLCPVVA